MLLWLNSDGGYRYKYISQNTAFVGYDRSEKCSECGREIVKLQYSGAEARYEVLGGSTYPTTYNTAAQGSNRLSSRRRRSSSLRRTMCRDMTMLNQ